MLKAKAANDQFLEGLQVTGVLDCLRKSPDIMKSLFCFKKTTLTAGNETNVWDIHILDISMIIGGRTREHLLPQNL